MHFSAEHSKDLIRNLNFRNTRKCKREGFFFTKYCAVAPSASCYAPSKRYLHWHPRWNGLFENIQKWLDKWEWVERKLVCQFSIVQCPCMYSVTFIKSTDINLGTSRRKQNVCQHFLLKVHYVQNIAVNCKEYFAQRQIARL